MTYYNDQCAVGFPEHEEDRARLREMFPGTPLPAKVPDSIVEKCALCRMECSVGPKIQEKLAEGVQLNCIFCIAGQVRAETAAHMNIKMQDLGNPNSRPEVEEEDF